jgi:CHAT domain-containing protein/Tfp pilus assembly protein PilF
MFILFHLRLIRTISISLGLYCILFFVVKIPKGVTQTPTVDTQKIDNLNNLGIQYFQKGLVKEAFTTLQEALSTSKASGLKLEEAVTLNNIGAFHEQLKQYQQALAYYQSVLTIFQRLDDLKGQDQALYAIGRVYADLEDYPQAINFFQRSLLSRRKMKDRRGESNMLYSIAVLSGKIKQYQTALNYFQQALSIDQELNNREGEGLILGKIAGVYFNLREYPQALNSFQQALAIFRQLGDRDREGAILHNAGLILNDLGQYQQALSSFREALSIFKAIGNRTEEARSLNSIGNVFNNLGQYRLSFERHQQALALYKTLDDQAGKAATLQNLGIIYDNLGQYQQALDSLQQALTIYESLNDVEEQGAVLGNIGAVLTGTGQHTFALEVYQKALEIAKTANDRLRESLALGNIGSTYIALNQPDKALVYHQQALKIHRALGDRAAEGRALSSIGQIYRVQKKYTQALPYYQSAITIAKNIGNQAGQISALTNIGAVYTLQRDYIKAENALREAVRMVESLRPDLADDQKISLFDTQLGSYFWLTSVLVAQNKIDAALEISEQSQARAFAELIATRSNSASTLVPKTTGLSVAEIRKIAQQQDATLVKYGFAAQNELHIWVVKPDGSIFLKSIDLSRLNTSLIDLINLSLSSINVGGRGNIKVAVKSNTKAPQQLQLLYQILIAPIKDYLPQDPNARVVFLPQGELFQVPFPALQDEKGQALLETHTMSMAPSIQVLQLTQRQRQQLQRSPAQTTLVVGNPIMPKITVNPGEPPEQLSPLPGAEQEANAIARLLNTNPLIGKQATESTILQKLPQARIIHFATHGLLDNFKGQGVPGAIALAPGNNQDGLLTSNEILDLKLKAELVVLSACDTGRGIITGDGVIGLSRSWMSAGVPSVLVSLWAVDDASTALLMTEFYKNWQQKKMDKAEALRQAMLTTRKQYPNPRNWAAFTLMGEAE